ncbi:hypothetical protein DFH09DRAFT_1068449 [Mycena vulgaris]|nr:hypothetical protein DFH09DRAFT_1068449 [Mycena vulgaris]
MAETVLPHELVPPCDALAPTQSTVVPGPSPHAAAQTRYRAKNAESKKGKARQRMRRLREERKINAASGETYEQFMLRECQELRASPEFDEFRAYCNTVRLVLLRCIKDLPGELAEIEQFLATNPCVEDLPPYDDDGVEYWYHLRHRYPEWKEELADFRDFVAEHTLEELDRLQSEARAQTTSKLVVRARGGF